MRVSREILGVKKVTALETDPSLDAGKSVKGVNVSPRIQRAGDMAVGQHFLPLDGKHANAWECVPVPQSLRCMGFSIQVRVRTN